MVACMSGTRGSGVLSSSGDVLEMSGSVGHVSVFWLRWCGWCRWGVGRGLGPGSGAVGWCYVCVSLDSLCRWQVQVSVYCAWRTPANMRCIQCSILLHLMDICFLTCICLWISQIQNCLFKVVGPGLVSTSPAFVSSSASHPAGPHAPPKTVNRAPHCWGREGSTQFAQQLESAVTAPPFVCCVVWSHPISYPLSSTNSECTTAIYICDQLI